MELEQLTATCQNLQWLKTELETKSGRWQKEQESALQQLQTSLCNKDKEMEARLPHSRALGVRAGSALQASRASDPSLQLYSVPGRATAFPRILFTTIT